ncbi:MAG: orotidine-5'-phosphate decarboxylase [Peptococcaceae bacterium]|nr:orotidine-5'-phosphate decarboxylase [Peptococcaceae bacterium]
MKNNPLIIALDVDTVEEAGKLADALMQHVGAFKVGMQLFNSAGPTVIRFLNEKKVPVFIDLKLHDIPNTVAGATRVLTSHGVGIINIHAAGGQEMMRAAAAAVREEAERLNLPRPLLVAVTILTSIDQEVFSNQIGFPGTIKERVTAWALMAQDAGLDGVVASPREIAPIRAACGGEFVIITPGVRPAGSAVNDQKRVMTPAEAIGQGATYLVIGRPVTGAPDPAQAARDILDSITAD